MSDLQAMTERIVKYRDARNWKQFHKPKDLAISLTLEATEVLEHFQWKSDTEMAEYLKSSKNDIAEELSDVLYWVLLMSRDLDIDLIGAFEAKMQKNEQKYPVEKAYGVSTKYTKL